jgi:integral membrane protein
MPNPVTFLRIVGLAEGVSFLVLLGIAMPLKYLAGRPEAVKVVGSLHGGLFLLYILAVLWAARDRKWSWGYITADLIASVLPFGPFVMDRHWRKEQQASLAENALSSR